MNNTRISIGPENTQDIGMNTDFDEIERRKHFKFGCSEDATKLLLKQALAKRFAVKRGSSDEEEPESPSPKKKKTKRSTKMAAVFLKKMVLAEVTKSNSLSSPYKKRSKTQEIESTGIRQRKKKNSLAKAMMKRI